ncbi:MAG: N-acetylmuramoyl-L-alanine amidase [Cyanobacteria bacterium P01_E01_bin.34]
MGRTTKLKGLVMKRQPVSMPQSSVPAIRYRWWMLLACWGLAIGGVSTGIGSSVGPLTATPAIAQANRSQTTQFPVNRPQTLLAQAAPVRLQSWSYNPALGRLDFSTQGQTRPRLFALDNPSRIVIDLPNVRLDRREEQQQYSGRVRSIRLSQFSPDIARLVMDIDPEQPITQQEIQLLTASPERWAVQLLIPVQFSSTQTVSSPPVAQAPATNSPPANAEPTRTAQVEAPRNNATQGSSIRTHILSIETTNDGFFVRTSGPVNVSTRRVFNPHRVAVDFLNTDISQMRSPREMTIDQFDVSMLRAGQFQPTIARIALDVSSTSGSWSGRYDAERGGVILTPSGSTPTTPAANVEGAATIQAVRVQGNQLSIAADGFMFYRSSLDEDTGSYKISVSPARLPDTMADPGLVANGPVERVRFAQENSRTVSILVEPADGVEVRERNSGQGSRHITLELVYNNLATAPSQSPSAQSPRPYPLPTPVPRPDLLLSPSRGAEPTAASNGIVVALDAGHGGRDPGAVGIGGLYEKTVNFVVATRVEQLLRQQGYEVVMTRSDDREIFLQPRIDTAVNGGADILVSIHTNALERSEISGIETYYLRADSARLAQTLHRSLVAGTGAIDRNIRRARFYMVRETPTSMPSVLLEMGYLTNPTEASRLGSPEYQERLAQAIAQGVATYFGR